MMRIRVHFCKTEAMRFTGHLDLHKTWERTFRRADLPLAYSQGFHPQPRLNLACALPLGFTSQAELIDAWLETSFRTEELQARLSSAAPPGIIVTQVEEVDLKAPTLQIMVKASEYEITVLVPVPDLHAKVNQVLSSHEISRQRRGKNYNLRALIEGIQSIPDTTEGLPRLLVQLSAREGATGRPEELLAAMGLDPVQSRVHRTRLILPE